LKKVNFSGNLKVLRTRKGLTQECLGSICNVSRQTVTKWESGESQPDLDRITELCSIMEVSLEEMIYGTIESSSEIEEVNNKIDELTKINIASMSKIDILFQRLFKKNECKPINSLYESYLQMRDDICEYEAGLAMLEDGRKAMNDLSTYKAYELFEQAISRGVTGAAFELMKLFADWYENIIEMESQSEIISLEVFCGKYMQIYGIILVEENIRKYEFDETIFR
jgi:transcriptional regulator with XRE-family HTH domain